MTRIAAGLSESEIAVVRQCLRATVEGAFFPEWEFQTLFGIERSVVQQVLRDWPDETVVPEDVWASVVGSLNHLLGYPHGREQELIEYVPAGIDTIRETLQRVARTRLHE